jgi:chromosome segregation ATPase
MKKIIFCLFVIAIIGCSDGVNARLGVVADKALKKFDTMLGDMEVKKKEIDLQIKGLKQGIAGINKAKIKAQVKLEEFSRKIEPLQGKLSEIDATLKKYQTFLVKNEPVELAGKTFTPEQLKANATKLIAARKQFSEEIAGYDKPMGELQKTATGLDASQKGLEAKLTTLQGLIAQIDTKMAAVQALRESKTAMGDGNASISENVANLEGKVNDLLGDIGSELASEGHLFDETKSIKHIDSIDSIISGAQGSKDTLSEINRILENGK